MSLKEQIHADFIQAFKNKDMDKKNFLGFLKSEIQNEETRPKAVSNDKTTLLIIRRIEKLLKQTDTPQSLVELTYLEPYQPILMSEDEIRLLVKTLIQSNENKNQGALIGLFNKENTDKAFDNSVLSKIIGEELLIK